MYTEKTVQVVIIFTFVWCDDNAEWVFNKVELLDALGF